MGSDTEGGDVGWVYDGTNSPWFASPDTGRAECLKCGSDTFHVIVGEGWRFRLQCKPYADQSAWQAACRGAPLDAYSDQALGGARDEPEDLGETKEGEAE